MSEKPFYITIKRLLLKSQSDYLTQGEIKELVSISRIIISSYLRHTKPRIIKLCENEGITLEDLSIDCIAELFEVDENKNFIRLNNLSNNTRLPLDKLPEVEVYLAFKGLLSRMADTQIARQYAIVDPNGYKIQRNIKEYIKSTKLLYLQKTIYGALITVNNDDNKDDVLPYYNNDDLEKDFHSYAKNKADIPSLMLALLKLLNDQNCYRKELLLTDCVSLFKKYFEISDVSLKTLGTEEPVSKLYEINELEINEIKQKVIHLIHEKIVLNYYAKSKLTKAHAEALHLTLCDIIEDWVVKGENGCSYFAYFKIYAEISEEVYCRILKAKVEYLVKIARNEFEYLLEIEK